MTETPTLLLVDDHDVVRRGTREILGGAFRVIGEADNASSAIELALERQPDLLLLDVRLPGGGGARVAREVRSAGLDTCIVAFTVSVNRRDVQEMLTEGVDGYVTKAVHEEELVPLLMDALEGGRPVSKDVAGYLLDIDDAIGPMSSSIDRLTGRERQVVHLIARGFTYAQCGDELGISVKTIESHMGNIFRKLGVASRWQLLDEYFRREEGGDAEGDENVESDEPDEDVDVDDEDDTPDRDDD